MWVDFPVKLACCQRRSIRIPASRADLECLEKDQEVIADSRRVRVVFPQQPDTCVVYANKDGGMSRRGMLLALSRTWQRLERTHGSESMAPMEIIALNTESGEMSLVASRR